VVIADDHPDVLVALDRMLKPFCDVVAAVSTGSDAVEAVIRLHPDVLVVDLMMPDMNGLNICRRVKEAAPGTDVVIVTAFADEQIETVALREGATAFVAKQHAAATLVRTIQEILANRPEDSATIE
jgi:DNA-binding NarL/FixJ family response regulator